VRLSIIVPAYNEERTIRKALVALLAEPMPACIESLEIIVVDDCSKDRTADIVEAFRLQHPQVVFVRHAENQGKGAAVLTGANIATGDTLLVQDADMELLPKDIPAMVNAMHLLGLPFINGSRYLPGVPRPVYTYSRYLGNKVFTWITLVLLNARLTDMACGYKLIDKQLFHELNLREKGFGIEAEMIIKALRKRRNQVAEVPVHYSPRGVGQGKKTVTQMHSKFCG
jgi:glycosyltransferase involved in cell wall biosynthesis